MIWKEYPRLRKPSREMAQLARQGTGKKAKRDAQSKRKGPVHVDD